MMTYIRRPRPSILGLCITANSCRCPTAAKAPGLRRIIEAYDALPSTQALTHPHRLGIVVGIEGSASLSGSYYPLAADLLLDTEMHLNVLIEVNYAYEGDELLHAVGMRDWYRMAGGIVGLPGHRTNFEQLAGHGNSVARGLVRRRVAGRTTGRRLCRSTIPCTQEIHTPTFGFIERLAHCSCYRRPGRGLPAWHDGPHP